VGILSGLNEMAWNPERDPALSTSYSAEDPSGKEACRATLRDEFNLPQEEVPLVSACVSVSSRSATNKGTGLVGSPWVRDRFCAFSVSAR
jgi:starch synthase